MDAEEARQYAKELQEKTQEARALGPLNKLLMWWCVHQVNRKIKRSVEQGFDYCIVVFALNVSYELKNKDKMFLADHFTSQGYHVDLRFTSMDISWAVERPWWFRSEKPWWYSGNDATREVK